MSSAELASRLGVSQQAVADLERNEMHDTIKLESLRRVADALDCDFVYFLVPRKPLEDEVRAQARRKAESRVAAVAHQGRLEDQRVNAADTEAQIEDEVGRLLNRRGLWADAK
jgi:predicted DNA-binding mobile mystery protein A